jgi:hypothetical protein
VDLSVRVFFLRIVPEEGVIVGNNLDEENIRQVETFDALNWACSENLGGCFVETSAKNNLGVKDAFPLISTRLSFLFVSFDLSLLLQLCLPSQNGALDVPFGFSFPDNFDLRSFFMRK